MGAQFSELSSFFFFLRGHHYSFLDLADLAASKVDAVTVGTSGWGERGPGICSPG